MSSDPISAEFRFESHFVEVNGSNMHYIDEGTGDPVLFLHGNPTSSYLWRNIIPYMHDRARCIAPDLIGMGKSDKPDIGYRLMDHYRYIEGFIHELGLKNITLVIHDWGSALGFHYAMQHEDNVKGIAFMEAILRPMKWSAFQLPLRVMFGLFRTPVIGELLNGRLNFFVNRVIPLSVVRTLTAEEKAHYAAPYPDYRSRKPAWQWPREIPIAGRPRDNYDLINSYWQKLQESSVPKLMITAKPGAILPETVIPQIEAKLPNLTTTHVGEGLHFIQEDNPHGIGEALQNWYATLT